MSSWWGDISFDLNECKVWRIGERFIAVLRKEREWCMWNVETKEETSSVLHIEYAKGDSFLNTPPTQRFLISSSTSVLTVTPKLADRAMVIRPSSILSVLPGEHAQLYVSTQLWISFALQGSSSPMFDIPLWKPSDSWFGESNMSGEICYAKYSEANVNLANLKKRSHRVFTSIDIRNEHQDILHIQRMKIPMPLLNLYVNKEQQFWTDKVSLVHNEDDNKPTFAIEVPKQQIEANTYTHLSNSRVALDTNVFMRSIKNLIA
jgi:hypothetical protein